MNIHAMNKSFDAIDKASVDSEIWNNLFNFVKNFSVDAMSYYHIPPAGSADFSDKYFIALGFCPDKTVEYRRNFSIFKSPFIDRCRPITEPLFWPEILDALKMRDEERTLLQDFYCTEKAKNGIVIPCFGPAGRNGCVVLRFDDTYTRFSRESIRLVQWMAWNAHVSLCKLKCAQTPDDINLTEREQEVLTWVARGKSNNVIAEIIGISHHTVNGYLRRIYLKTGTSDRTVATLRAVSGSLIDP